MSEAEQQLRAYVEYFRDLGVHDFYRFGDPVAEVSIAEQVSAPVVGVAPLPRIAVSAVQEKVSPLRSEERVVATPDRPATVVPSIPLSSSRPDFLEPPSLKLVNFNDLAPLPAEHVAAADRPAALRAIQEEIGDCTRCPLAYAGRHKIVFADGDPNARLIFVGEGPGADEDAQGLPFVGKAGQLLNNMISAMGLKREQVYIANIVKCRPPGNRTPEPVEATTCSQFLLKQIDVVQPEFIVALGSTAATYLLGVKQSLAGLRGRWHSCRGARLAVTYHPAFLLRDPRQKAEAWKDLQMVMKEMGLKAPSKE